MSVHVVFGSGAVGRATSRALLRRGFEVRLVYRRGRHALGSDAAEFADVEVLAGDATDAGFTTRAAANASTVYQTLNPEYYRWAEDFPPLQRGVLAAAQASGARYVSMDNVYSYGRPHGRVLDERTPENTHTKKGQIRLKMARELWAAHQAGRVNAVSGRASDYYGPGGGDASPLGDRVLSAVVAGKRVSLFGNPDLVHTYTYIPDIGEGLSVLGTADDVTGRAWHLPNDPNPWTSRAMTEELFRLAGTPPRIGSMPKLGLLAVGLFNPTVRELAEMAYEFDEPFVVDSHDIAALGVHATPIADALAQTLDAFRTRAAR
ncbi:MAG TPA: NAD-dependent epimerase/dehydratase family protein [Microbacterium sp.]|nr:NAD-dependent epimerase/dehydratase family protein [Microbacterium sp.]